MPKKTQTITSPPTWIDGTRWNGSTEKVQLISPATLLQSGLIQFCWAHAHRSLIYLFLADISGTQCGLVLLWPICFKLWRVVHSEKPLCIPFYCCLSISSKQSSHSSLTSAVVKEFLSKEPALTACFSFFSFGPRTEMIIHENSRRSSVLEIFNLLLAHQQPRHTQSHPHYFSSPFRYIDWTSANPINHVSKPKWPDFLMWMGDQIFAVINSWAETYKTDRV